MSNLRLTITLAIFVIAVFVAGWLGMRTGGAKISFLEYLSPFWTWRKKRRKVDNVTESERE
jgi:cytochrome b561